MCNTNQNIITTKHITKASLDIWLDCLKAFLPLEMLHEIQKARCPNARAAKETSKPLLLTCLTKTSLASVQNSDSSHEGQLRWRWKNKRKEPLLPLFHSSFLLVTYTSQAKKCSPRLALLADAGLKLLMQIRLTASAVSDKRARG